jgi:hypothetical protein
MLSLDSFKGHNLSLMMLSESEDGRSFNLIKEHIEFLRFTRITYGLKGIF